MVSINYFLLIAVIYLQTMIWFQVCNYNPNNFFLAHELIEYEYFCKRSIWPLGGILIGTTTSGLSGPVSNGNEGTLHNSQISRTRASPSDTV